MMTAVRCSRKTLIKQRGSKYDEWVLVQQVVNVLEMMMSWIKNLIGGDKHIHANEQRDLRVIIQDDLSLQKVYK